jgi:CO dehydrogenase nickel-insertion accessory protein CooC1
MSELTITIRGKIGTGKTTLAVWLHHALLLLGVDVVLEDPDIGRVVSLGTGEVHNERGSLGAYVDRLLGAAKAFRHLGRVVVKTEQAPRVGS